jgi:hypothetical protein
MTAPEEQWKIGFKESQMDLFSDRTPTHEFRSNQLRLWFSTFAYLLMQFVRKYGLASTELANAQVRTIRPKLLKIGAQIRLSVRRIVIAFSSSWAGESLFHHAYQKLKHFPQTE